MGYSSACCTLSLHVAAATQMLAMGICPAGPDRRHGCPPGMPYVSGRPGSHSSLSLATQLWGGLPALHVVVRLTWLLGSPDPGSVIIAVRFASVRDADVLKPQREEAPRAWVVCPVVRLLPCRLSLLPPCLAFGKQHGCMHRAAAGWGSDWRCRGPGAVLTLAPKFSFRAERPSSGISLQGSETFCH